MAERHDGGPAFPVIGAPGAPEDFPGMSLRDHFAGQALAGLLCSTHPDHSAPSWEAYAACAYGHADAMIAERAK